SGPVAAGRGQCRDLHVATPAARRTVRRSSRATTGARIAATTKTAVAGPIRPCAASAPAAASTAPPDHSTTVEVVRLEPADNRSYVWPRSADTSEAPLATRRRTVVPSSSPRYPSTSAAPTDPLIDVDPAAIASAPSVAPAP